MERCFAEIDAASSVIEQASITTTPVHIAWSSENLTESPLHKYGAELLRQNTAPEGWSGVKRFILDRHPPLGVEGGEGKEGRREGGVRSRLFGCYKLLRAAKEGDAHAQSDDPMNCE